MAGLKKVPSESGSRGKRGHSATEHGAEPAEIKDAARKVRRNADTDGMQEYFADDDAPSPCPVCGAGPEQSSDPQHMSRAVCYCGHPRFYDYKVRSAESPDSQAD